MADSQLAQSLSILNQYVLEHDLPYPVLNEKSISDKMILEIIAELYTLKP